ncbi:adenylyl-sulfate kinase [Catenulispora yoronensis]|uniref:adenylyl-sulfate kinase n=1 Tax=Catenulispora yoronensis TaxID=450799 RepID=UPI0031CE05B4
MSTTVPPAPTAPTTPHPGATIWLTGLPSAGKSTIASALALRLRAHRHHVEILDGDALRRTVSANLGFGRADREAHVHRVGGLAETAALNGAIALVPVIAPYAISRDRVRRRHAAKHIPFLEIHVATPLAVCARRDVKGLYARQAAGELSGLTGVDDPYEPPTSPDLRINTEHEPVSTSVATVWRLLASRGLIAA